MSGIGEPLTISKVVFGSSPARVALLEKSVAFLERRRDLCGFPQRKVGRFLPDHIVPNAFRHLVQLWHVGILCPGDDDEGVPLLCTKRPRLPRLRAS